MFLLHRSASAMSAVVAVAFCSLDLAAAPFVVYDHLLYQGRPDLSQYGMPRYDFVAGGTLWPAGTPKKSVERCQPHEATIRQRAMSVRDKPRIVVDIEEPCWNPTNATSDADFQERVRKYLTVANIWNQEAPNNRMGFYAIVPPRNYPAAKSGNPAALAAWRAHNDKLAPIGQAVDIINPSLYTFENNLQAWVRYAQLTIEEAKQYGKPVIPVIWPEYHPSASTSGLIDGPFWKLQLNTIRNTGVGGLIIWSQARPWNENAAWWAETKLFLGSPGGSEPPPTGSPGALQFTAPTYNVSEGGRIATVTVSRTGGSTGAVSVAYTTAAGGTATEGADYAFTNGALNWSDGDVMNKTFTVPIIDDTDVEGRETVNLSLAIPDGGATLGARRTAAVSIADNDGVANGSCAGRTATIVGTSGDDALRGTVGPDVIAGLNGNDVIRGGKDVDVICGGVGDDQLYGGPGDDQLMGEDGDDRLDGLGGVDSCDGGSHVTTTGDRAVKCETQIGIP